MKKTVILVLLLIIGNTMSSQKLITRTGEIKFEASIPAFEQVAAKNNTVSSILDTKTGDFVSLALIKAFKFKVPLMEEHFNENYIESSSFPKSTFKGKIIGFDYKKLTDSKIAYDLEGDLTIHGVTKKIKVKAYLYQNAKKTVLLSSFSIKPVDYGIKIPNIVKSKIAEDVKVSFQFTMEQQ